MRFDRVKSLFRDDFSKIAKSKILLLGVGGVGGYCLDCLYRSGVKDITIVDYDIFDETNQNRQIGSENVGEKKVKSLANIYKNISYIDLKITPEEIKTFDFDKYDLVIDAIDDLPSKVALAHKVYGKLISSCGAAKRIDPTKIQIASIWKTTNDPFAKKFRNQLKKSGFKNDFDVVFSSETPKAIKELGSFVGVTGCVGLTLCSLALRKLVVS
ncbi:MAG: tRNA threonylcarbamoyladenosine dehydratase [Epsilonproteobacteria bacterium]|jgi:tRNA A37 threonylcarbamoyladenosine dehydratase|nr:tRNA threonylcarbamoyladenosine dehydratase [Campylobacterota bacterium]